MRMMTSSPRQEKPPLPFLDSAISEHFLRQGKKATTRYDNMYTHKHIATRIKHGHMG